MPSLIGSTQNMVHVIFFSFVLNFHFLAYSFAQIFILIVKNNLCKFQSHSSKIEKMSFLIGNTQNMVYVIFFSFVLNFHFWLIPLHGSFFLLRRTICVSFEVTAPKSEEMVIYHFSPCRWIYCQFYLQNTSDRQYLKYACQQG